MKHSLKQMIPVLQDVQARFDEIIADIISERILHEMCLYRTNANQKNNIKHLTHTDAFLNE